MCDCYCVTVIVCLLLCVCYCVARECGSMDCVNSSHPLIWRSLQVSWFDVSYFSAIASLTVKLLYYLFTNVDRCLSKICHNNYQGLNKKKAVAGEKEGKRCLCSCQLFWHLTLFFISNFSELRHRVDFKTLMIHFMEQNLVFISISVVEVINEFNNIVSSYGSLFICIIWG